MGAPQHISVPLEILLAGLAETVDGCDPRDAASVARVVRRLGNLRTTLENGEARHLGEICGLAVKLLGHVSGTGSVGAEETMDVVEQIVAVVRSGLDLPRREPPAATLVAALEVPPRRKLEPLRLADAHRLGDLLVTLSMLTAADVERALHQQKRTGQRLGQVLVDQGVLTPSSIDAALRLQSQRRRRG
jgi:hypothetical protein